MSVIIFITVGIELSESEKAFLLLSVMLLNLLKFQRGGDIAKYMLADAVMGPFHVETFTGLASSLRIFL